MIDMDLSRLMGEQPPAKATPKRNIVDAVLSRLRAAMVTLHEPRRAAEPYRCAVRLPDDPGVKRG